MVRRVICVLAGGVGAARLLAGLVRVVPPAEITVVGNVGDDLVLHGLHISPDLDTITYTLADQVDPDRGWGLRDETWQAMDMVGRYGGVAWFNLGDRDLGTHLYRTHRLSEGATLSEVTAEVVAAWELGFRLLPVTDDPIRTRVTVVDPDAEREVGFQEWFVQRRHDVAVRALRFAGVEEASPAPGVLEAILEADAVVVAPSNPLVSIGPLLAVAGVEDAVRSVRDKVVAVSPIVAGAALKGPADQLMTDLGHEATVVGVARLYADLAGTLVIDEADAALVGAVEAEGMRALATPTVMSTPDVAAELGRTLLGAVDVAP
ncbi:2-phospho-L-lactate transferase [Iamia sp. SCSIO 61187]|uniref:2-phospho-L-lactate transferase n=1 Tax=Iamia sp. SCSIO 61187 TaxID=2722752 RepID=UPI001C633BE5|nr:2-phospho-L-lactate transferase [Iamia sp. SCSIO 61187]QYG93789.1 2-phospho-L-lactate transferase [Iamia sp. SCSIO 61187]